MATHFEGSDEGSGSLADLIAPIGFEVYGPAPPAAIDQLRGEAAALGVALDLHHESFGSSSEVRCERAACGFVQPAASSSVHVRIGIRGS